MIKAAIEKILEISENKIHEINGQFYADKRVTLIEPPVHKPSQISVNSLDGLVKLIAEEGVKNGFTKIFISIDSHRKVSVFTTYGENFERFYLYEAESDAPGLRTGYFEDYERTMILLRSAFIQNEGTAYLLDILSRISNEESVASSDNGMTQTVEVKKGIALQAKETVKARVKLTPYRTFLEVEQPESEFLVRLNKDGEIAIFEADGGMWKLYAKESISQYLERELEDYIADGTVVVMK